MNRQLLITLLILGGVVWGEVQSCGSCGMECESACGTRHFRTCCFNYLKKRSQLPETLPLALDPSLRLELWLAKSRNPPFQRLPFESAGVSDMSLEQEQHQQQLLHSASK